MWKRAILSFVAILWICIHFVNLDVLVSFGHVSFGSIIGNGSVLLATQGSGSVRMPVGVNFTPYFYRNPPSDPFSIDPFDSDVSVPTLTDTVRGEFDFRARTGPNFSFSITFPFWILFLLIASSLVLPRPKKEHHNKPAMDKPDPASS